MNTMTIIRDSHPIRKQRNGRVALSLLVLIFIGTSALAFIFTPSNEIPPRPFTVTATVVQPSASNSSSDSASGDDDLKGKILSETNIARAVEIVSPKKTHSGGIAGESMEELRQKLSVSGEKTADGQVKTAITYSGHGNSGQVCRFVDALAEGYARQDTQQRRMAARAAHEKAKTAAEKANSELVKARDDYEAFVDQHFTSKLSPAVGPVPPGTQLIPPTPGLHVARPDWAEAPESPTLANPRWTELNNKLTKLKTSRAEMLETMTPAHPGVQNVEIEIENIERRISSLPSELARPTRDSLPPITPKPPGPTDNLLAPGGEGRLSHTHTAENGKSQRKTPSLITSPTARFSNLNPRLKKDFQQKKKSLEAARQKHDRLAGLEQAAWQKLSNVQQSEVIPAVGPEMEPRGFLDSASELPPRHILASLIIGLCSVVGIGMFSAGFSPPPTFANVAEVRNALKTPVVGTMPAADLPGVERPSTRRPALATSGLLFLLAAVAMVITSFVIM